MSVTITTASVSVPDDLQSRSAGISLAAHNTVCDSKPALKYLFVIAS